MNTLKSLLDKINTKPETIVFNDVIELIDIYYNFTPTTFKNGDTNNEANQNNGSCKVFAFAKLHQLTAEQTLNLFGSYYRKDVLENPDKDDHQNIRNFIKYNWEGIKFEGEALSQKL